jgi:hypothetical protein
MLTRTVFALALSAAVFTGAASAESLQSKAVLTFDAPVAVGDVVLPPGKYMFRRVENLSHRNILKVESLDRISQAMFIRVQANYSVDTDGKVRAELMDRGASAPPALKTLRFPNDTFGVSFMSPRAMPEERLAKTPAPSQTISD